MLLPYSKILIFDNSKASLVSCISLLRGSKKKGATLGEILVASIKKLNFKNKSSKYKKGSICSIIITKLNRNLRRYGHLYIKVRSNGGILINSDNLPIASRLFGVIYREFKDLQFFKIALLAEFLI